MKKTAFTLVSAVILFWVIALFGTLKAQTLAICTGEYALCAASSTKWTGKLMQVNGKTFKEGTSVCPVLTGSAIGNLSLMGGSCDSPKNMVWSLFGVPPVSSFPQAPNWDVVPAVSRTFVTTNDNGMSNMWSFPCLKHPNKLPNGVQLADCFGPLNESPFDGGHVKVGTKVVTQAPVGAPDPVGGNLP